MTAACMNTDCIVVGIDDSAASRAAHRWAAAYANVTGKDLRVIHVLEWPIGLIPSTAPGTRLHVPQPEVAEAYRRGMQRVFDDIASPQGSTLQFAQGDTADVLVRLSTHANLLVIGTREPSGGASSPTSFISHYCVSHASCPVVTVPAIRANLVADLAPRSTLHHDQPFATTTSRKS